MQDIHDIRPPIVIGMDPWILKAAFISLAVFLVALAGYLLFRYIRKRDRDRAAGTLLLPPPLPPDEAALRELEAMKEMVDSMPRLFLFRLINVMKTYLGRQYELGIPEMTNQEVISAIRRLDLDRKASDGVRKFFLSTEAITYAGQTPTRQRLNQDWEFIHGFIVAHARSRADIQAGQEVQ